VVLALILGQFAYLVWVGGDWVVVHASRYLMVAMPLYLVLLVGGTWQFLVRLRARRMLGAQVANAFFVAQLLLFAWLLNPAPSMAEWIFQSAEPMYRQDNVKSVQFGRTLCEYTVPDTKVGIFWAGVAPYLCEREYVDLLGRADRRIARKKVDSFRGPGHAKRDWDYVLHEARPDVFATMPGELLGRADFEENFCLARLPTPRIVFPARKESASKILDPELRLCHPTAYPPCIPCSSTPLAPES
jgi:hypothetical protein